MTLFECIPYGRENAISEKELRRESGLGRKELYRQIRLAKETEPILLCGDGYYRADLSDREELRAYVKRAGESSLACLRRLRAAKALLQDMEKGALAGRQREG